MDVKGVNENLLLAQRLLAPNYSQDPFHDMGHLAKILKARNQRLRNNQQQPSSSQPTRSLNLDRLTEKVKKATQADAQKQKWTEIANHNIREFESGLTYQTFTLDNQHDYVLDHNEYLADEILRKQFDSLGNVERNLKNKLKQRIFNCVNFKPAQISVKKSLQRDASNRAKYHQFVMECRDCDQSLGNAEPLLRLEGKNFWPILIHLIKAYQQSRNSQQNANQDTYITLVRASLQMIEDNFSQILPQQEREINQFMQQRYMSAANHQQYEQGEDGLYHWAIAYAYLRAGRLNNLYKKLTQIGEEGIQLRENMCEFMNSIQKLGPQPQYMAGRNITDPFYQQMMAIIKGETKFMDPRFFQLGSEDLVWIILMTYKLYAHSNPKKAKEYRNIMVQFTEAIIASPHLHSNAHEHLIYLCAYPELMACFQNTLRASPNFNYVDYLHLLLVVIHSQFLPQKDHNLVEETMQRSLEAYIKSLVQTDPGVAPYYILLIPSNKFGESLVRVFTNLQEFKDVDSANVRNQEGWDFVREKFQQSDLQEEFDEGMFGLAQSLVLREKDSKNQFFIIQRIQKLIADPQIQQKVAIMGLCHHLVTVENNLKLKNVANSFISSSSPLQVEEYLCLSFPRSEESKGQTSLQKLKIFFSQYSRIYTLLHNPEATQNSKQVKETINDQATTKSQGGELVELIKCLSRHGGSEVYYNYMRNILTAMDSMAFFHSEKEDSQRFRREITDRMKKIKNVLPDQAALQMFLDEVAH